PRSKGLKAILDEWIAFRFETVTRRTRHRLAEVDRRLHILEGRQLALAAIDKVIRIIRRADDPKAELIAELRLSPMQADDILEIRLRQLARLEAIKIDNELKTLKAERKSLKQLLGEPRAMSKLVIDEIEADAERFGDDRRTKIEAVAPIVVTRSVPDEPVTITLSRHGWIRSRQGVGLDAAQLSYKAGDGPLAVLETRTIHPAVVLDTQGRAYTIRAADVPGGRGDGVPVTTLIDVADGARVAQAIAGVPEQKFLVTGSGGYGFVASIEDMVSRVRGGKAFMTLTPNEEPLTPVPLGSGLTHVAALSSKGRLLVFPLDEMREVPRGRGVIMMALDGDEKLAAVGLTSAERVVLKGVNRTGRDVVQVIEGEELRKHLLRRARRGSLVTRRIRVTGFGREA
ncbi:MAG TPA: DNA gyrase subunit A, partial [Casimicrobiaceae bacterium]|nr:DNA gyrase subunit A [Casimicrobiaceae bacterium]